MLTYVKKWTPWGTPTAVLMEVPDRLEDGSESNPQGIDQPYSKVVEAKPSIPQIGPDT